MNKVWRFLNDNATLPVYGPLRVRGFGEIQILSLNMDHFLWRRPIDTELIQLAALKGSCEVVGKQMILEVSGILVLKKNGV